jgi:hypothetical protein
MGLRDVSFELSRVKPWALLAAMALVKALY